MVKTMKEGLFLENDELVYYKKGYPYHAGVVKVDGDIYYIGSQGRAVKGRHIVHREMGNDIRKRGTYTFGEDYKLVKGSYVAPKKHKKKHSTAKKRRFSRTSRKTGKGLLILAATIAVVIVSAVALDYVIRKAPGQENPGETNLNPAEIILPTFDGDVLLCAENVKQFCDGKIAASTVAGSGDPYQAFTFTYDLRGKSGTMLLSKSEDLSNPTVFVLAADETRILIDNLETGTTYYYNVIVDGKEYVGSFKTADTTRFISMPGVVNVRDIGGYTTQGGKKVKQGLLIRGPEIDGLVNSGSYVSGENAAIAKDTFGFVFEMDLRAPDIYAGVYKSRFGDDVRHSFFNAPQYGEIFHSWKLEDMQRIFTALAEPGNYPMYMHCTHGADRAGTIVFLLQGILNMSEENMIREYQKTAFVYASYADTTSLEIIMDGLNAYEGDSLSQKIVSYMITEVGITEEQIQSIRDIYLTQ